MNRHRRRNFISLPSFHINFHLQLRNLPRHRDHLDQRHRTAAMTLTTRRLLKAVAAVQGRHRRGPSWRCGVLQLWPPHSSPSIMEAFISEWELSVIALSFVTLRHRKSSLSTPSAHISLHEATKLYADNFERVGVKR